ncbi:Peptidylprolyl isomerase [Saliniradius amylolyticus]|uniref:Peptidyl-prolyl cis-trans isomerase n=1 Tax=Saliniradius amylolyticus TaxID=2183582 RepID=A0A2S2E497_9ALTE|nr:peptidylprolyl isomerase [Saliniradius amylolyticus]AWL12464.1 Peptidylprolyl isomerase [Saliniradius amylolyticus]
MKIEPNTVVTMHYTVSTDEGVEIDSSRNAEPMTFIHGQNFLIKGLEEELEGKAAGDTFETKVEPEKAYGERHDQLMQAVPKSMFEGMDVEVGMQFRATTDAGDQSVTVVDVADDEVVVDGNHPLAGITLNFDVEVVDVREATAEELEHGHVHGEGGCDHDH